MLVRVRTDHGGSVLVVVRPDKPKKNCPDGSISFYVDDFVMVCGKITDESITEVKFDQTHNHYPTMNIERSYTITLSTRDGEVLKEAIASSKEKLIWYAYGEGAGAHNDDGRMFGWSESDREFTNYPQYITSLGNGVYSPSGLSKTEAKYDGGNVTIPMYNSVGHRYFYGCTSSNYPCGKKPYDYDLTYTPLEGMNGKLY